MKLNLQELNPEKRQVTKYMAKSDVISTKAAPTLFRMRKRVAMQAGLAVLTVVLTIVIVFAMSAAWYTNIVHTNGLTFQVEAWGFDGKIDAEDVTIVAGPGDDGLICLEAESDSDSISSLSVSISKAQMDKKMQQRLFFYADTTMVRNEETMERVYLNTQESYTYTLFSQGKLTLNETLHNDTQLKWMWVYDVLGYYVQGNYLSNSDDIVITEYLRPIEYDYDASTWDTVTTSDENGNVVSVTKVLKTVDGKTTPEEFLQQLFKTDGYEGNALKTPTATGYYPVDVDEYGNGVYAYLCSYTEIEQATQYDTDLGELAKKAAGDETVELPTYKAILTVSAQKNKNNVLNVTTLAGLQAAIESGAADVIELTEDITVGSGETLVVSADTEAMIDLGGCTLTNASGSPITVKEGGSLTMINGAVTAAVEKDSGYAFYAEGGDLVLSNVDITGYEAALRVTDSADTNVAALDSTIRVVDCDWKTTETAVLIYGNGSDSAQATRLIIEDSTIVSQTEYGICGNGSTGNEGTDIQIINSTITSVTDAVYAGIFHPQKNSTLTIYNSTVSGYTGLVIKGGDVSIVASTINGCGAKNSAGFFGSGFADTGDAVYIETNYDYDIRLEISNAMVTDTAGNEAKRVSLLNSTYGYSLQVYEADAENVTVKLCGGVFNRVTDTTPLDAYVATGYVGTAAEDGTYTVTEETTTNE